MKAALVAELNATTAVTALVNDRIAFVARKQGEPLPSIALMTVSGVREYDLTKPAGLVEARVQADCYGATFASAQAVANAVRKAIEGRAFTRSSVRFQGVFLNAERDLSEGNANDGVRVFRVSLDFTIWHEEA